MFTSKEEFLDLCFMLFTGMTICLAIYAVVPNGIHLREMITGHDVCSQLVIMLRKVDTATNVCPSIHVFATHGVLMAVMRSPRFAGKADAESIFDRTVGTDLPGDRLFETAFGDRPVLRNGACGHHVPLDLSLQLAPRCGQDPDSCTFVKWKSSLPESGEDFLCPFFNMPAYFVYAAAKVVDDCIGGERVLYWNKTG